MIYTFEKIKVYRSISGAVALMILLAGALYFLHSKKTAIEEDVGSRIDANLRSHDILRIDKFISENSESFSVVARYFSVATDTVTVIENVETLGREFNVRMTIEQADKRVEAEGAKTSLILVASASGSWENIFPFIKGLETLPHIHNIEKIDLANTTATDENTITSSWKTSFILTFPFQQITPQP
jgi:Tfp pilus assembly protein PilO